MSVNSAKLDSANIFQASYPKHMKKPLVWKIAKVIYDIFSLIIFPIAICRYIYHRVHVFLGYHLFIPSQSYSKRKKIMNWFIDPQKMVKQKKYLRKGRQNLKDYFNAKTINIKTADGAKLNGVFIPGKDTYGRSLEIDGPLIIHFLGQFGRYEDMGHYQQVLANIKNHNILVFNDRGVVKSTAIGTREGLFLDAEAILQYARKKLTVPKEKITLHGHSFGGVKATYLASKHRNVKLLNDRSFSSLEKAVYFMAKEMFHSVFSTLLIMPVILIEKLAFQKLVNKMKDFVKAHKIYFDEKLQKPVTVAKIIRAVSSVLAFILAKITVIFGWGLNPGKDWQKVKGKKIILFIKNDETIPEEIGLFNAVKKTEKQFIRILDPDCKHWSAISKDIFNEALRLLEA